MDAQGNGQSARLTVRAESKTCTRAEDCESRGRPAFRLSAERILASPWDRLPALLTLQEAATRSRLSSWTVRHAIHSSQRPALQAGRRLLVPREALQEFLERGRTVLTALQSRSKG